MAPGLLSTFAKEERERRWGRFMRGESSWPLSLHDMKKGALPFPNKEK